MQALENIARRLRGARSPGRGGPQLVQVMSDLHLEVGQQYEAFDFPAAGRLLVLAGDVGRLIDYEGYRGFLERQAGRFERVFLVLGNHEFFGLGYEEGIARAERLAREPALRGRLVLLDRGVWADGESGSVIVGCTLWSHIPDPARAVVGSRVSDYRQIRGWSVDRHNQVHGEESAWLASALQSLSEDRGRTDQQGRNILVVTHHAPSLAGTSAPEHAGNPWTPAFATDLLPDLQTGRVKTWVFGHTHHTTELCCGGVRLVANQRGYVLPGGRPETTTATTAQNTNTSWWPWARKPAVRPQFDPERVVEL
ncbi:hypothetical protein KVR01_007267 [Diaporthe batatas]|uniref:uncharacterized protein n=1 Tax=Diaporthe batatas TaxID=748121 RepID=UPI001D057F81|nr:uncharacterized protein KVR01_007267 [Diaporthe batatas]KAG8162789.1 hypothetical protein KVR01_007267 [Diaporthe batatas]